MQLHSSTFDPTATGAELICRRGRGGLVAFGLVLWAVPVAWWFLDAPRFIGIACAVLAALINSFLLSIWRNRGRSESWTLAVSPERLWINMRNGDHQYGQASSSVVSLDYSEVREAARFVRRTTSPAPKGGTSHHKLTYLDLRLFKPIPENVRESLDGVYRERLPTRSYLGGAVKVTSRVTSNPLTIVDPTTLRIHWSGQDQSVKPRLAKVLGLLSNRVGLGEPTTEPELDWESLDESAFDRYLVELSRSGNRIDAVSAVQQRLALSLTQAKEFVESAEGRSRN